MFASGDAGDYRYAVTAINLNGETAPVFQSGAGNPLAITAGDAATVTITHGTLSSDAVAFALFRSKKGAVSSTTEVEFLAKIARSGGSTTVFVDFNHLIPGASKAFLMYMDQENLTWKQLAPLMKLDLAVISASFRWMQLLYGTPILFTPRKNIEYINIGRAVSSALPVENQLFI